MADDPPLTRNGAFAPLLSSLPTDGDIIVSERTGLGIAAAFKTGLHASQCERQIEVVTGVKPSAGLGAVAAKGSTIVATGPGAWLILREEAPPNWASELEQRLADCAAVVDQSTGYAVLRLAGDAASALLAKGVFIDLHPQVFRPGHAAITVIAHIGVILWRRPDTTAFEVAIFRSYAGSFWHWLTTAAQAEGLRLARAG